MLRWYERYKPAARRRTQLLLAALLWSLVGLGLCLAGLRWVLHDPASRTWQLVALALAATAGFLKARFVLARVARRARDRILARGDRRCIGGFLSVGSWITVLLMMASGRLLRLTPLPLILLGSLYAAIGTALLLASWHYWRAWRAVA